MTLPLECRVCGEDDVTELIKRKGAYSRICRACHRVQVREYREKNREQINIRQRRKRAADPEKVREEGRRQYRLIRTQTAATAHIGRAVKAWRLKHGIPQRVLFEALGIDERDWSWRERGHRNFKPHEIRRMIELGVDVYGDGETVQQVPPGKIGGSV